MQGRSTPAIFAAICVIAATLAACGGGGKSSKTPTAPAAAHVTSIPEVDHLIDAAESVDVIALAGLTGYEKVPCSTSATGQPGEPPVCRSGEADGDTVEVLASTACEGGWVRPEAVPEAYRSGCQARARRA